MALSPNAPDYVSQVRGIIGDVREDYLKKQQLFQQEQQAGAQLALGYAQLAAQRDNQARQANLDAQRIEASNIDNMRQAAQLNSQLSQRQIENDLAYGKFDLDRQKEERRLQVERDAEARDKTAAALEQKYRIAALKGDPIEVNSVLDEIGQSNLDRLQRVSITQNVNAGLEANRKLEEADRNLKTATPARGFIGQFATLDPAKLNPEQYLAQADALREQFLDLNNTDPRVNDAFSKSYAGAVDKLNKYKESEIGSLKESFRKMAAQKTRLEPEWQKKYDDLVRSPDYSEDALQGLMFAYNKAKAIDELKGYDNRFSTISQNLINQNPGLAITKTDPITGETYRTFTYPIPDLTPTEGYNATIDPETGLITKSARDRMKKWEDEVTSPNFLYGQVPMIRQFQTQQANVPPAQPTKPSEKGKSTAQTAPLPFRSGSTFDVGQPGTVTIPTAPKQQVQISPATIAIIVEAYRKDPNAVFNGRKAVEILSTLKSRGYEIPGMIVTPGTQDTGQIR